MEELLFVRCQNCGKYYSPAEATGGSYCSRECTIRYTSCLTCGRYIALAGEGNVSYCSSECAAVYEFRLDERMHRLLEEEES